MQIQGIPDINFIAIMYEALRDSMHMQYYLFFLMIFVIHFWFIFFLQLINLHKATIVLASFKNPFSFINIHFYYFITES